MDLSKQSLLFLVSQFCFGLGVATASVQNLADEVTVSYNIESHNYNLRLSPLEQELPRIDYRPNTQAVSGFQVSYKGITLAYLTSSDPSDHEVFLKGKTSYEDIRGGIFFGSRAQWAVLGYYNRYKGLFIDNSTQVDASIGDNDPRIQRPDISVFSSGVTLVHIFSPQEFSASAGFTQSHRQTKSGGSWLASVSSDLAYIRGDSALVPTSLQSAYGVDSEITEGKFATVSASIGYGHTLVSRSFYVMALVLVGRGIQEREFTVSDEQINEAKAVNKFSSGASLGYNGKSFFAGLAFIQDNIHYTTRSMEFSPNFSSVKYFVGGRF